MTLVNESNDRIRQIQLIERIIFLYRVANKDEVKSNALMSLRKIAQDHDSAVLLQQHAKLLTKLLDEMEGLVLYENVAALYRLLFDLAGTSPAFELAIETALQGVLEKQLRSTKSM